jgi:type I restriction enzyme M protein
VDRTRREFSDGDINHIARTYHAWRGETHAGEYKDIAGFCKSASVEEIKSQNDVLTPGRYVGVPETEGDGVPFQKRLGLLSSQLDEQLGLAESLAVSIKEHLLRLTAK